MPHRKSDGRLMSHLSSEQAKRVGGTAQTPEHNKHTNTHTHTHTDTDTDTDTNTRTQRHRDAERHTHTHTNTHTHTEVPRAQANHRTSRGNDNSRCKHMRRLRGKFDNLYNRTMQGLNRRRHAMQGAATAATRRLRKAAAHPAAHIIGLETLSKEHLKDIHLAARKRGGSRLLSARRDSNHRSQPILHGHHGRCRWTPRTSMRGQLAL